MLPPRSLRFFVCALILPLAVACEGGGDSPSPPQALPSPTAEAVPLAGVIPATFSAGDARIALRVRAQMPPAFDDGVPDRVFSGRGFLELEEGVAGITYRLGPAPNAAGYFGQTDPKTSVFYAGDGFTLSFPTLAKVLPGSVDWARYELDYFSEPHIRELGIGQLREVGLSDPRLAAALLDGGPELLTQGVPKHLGQESVTVYRFDADLTAASESAEPQLKAQLEELIGGLGVSEVPVALMIDLDHRLRRLSYRMEYPPAPDSPPVKLQVRVDFLELGLEGGLTPPERASVVDYEDYVKRVSLPG